MRTFEANITALDRATRAWVGLMLLSTPLLELPGAFPYNLIGLVPLVTGLVGICPAYALGAKLGKRRPRHVEAHAH